MEEYSVDIAKEETKEAIKKIIKLNLSLQLF